MNEQKPPGGIEWTRIHGLRGWTANPVRGVPVFYKGNLRGSRPNPWREEFPKVGLTQPDLLQNLA